MADAEPEEATVELGYVEPCSDRYNFAPENFPSKVGGRPVWLNSQNPLSPEEIVCPRCENQLKFLCQIYSPREDLPDNAWHRTYYVYVCEEAGCFWTPGALRVFRYQIPQENEIYPSELPEENSEENSEEDPTFEETLTLGQCVVCSLKAEKTCSQCHEFSYCCRDHQSKHWNRGHRNLCGHRNKLGNLIETAETIRCNLEKFSFPEFEIIFEPEPEKEEEELDEHVQRILKKYEKSILKNEDQAEPEILEAFAKEQTQLEHDDVFLDFQERCSLSPEQVFRFPESTATNAEPLWCGSQSQIKLEDVPPCPLCSKPRKFDFQIMPQLLSDLNEMKLDWASLCVYTCPDSCGNGDEFVDEYIHWQEPIQHLGPLTGLV